MQPRENVGFFTLVLSPTEGKKMARLYYKNVIAQNQTHEQCNFSLRLTCQTEGNTTHFLIFPICQWYEVKSGVLSTIPSVTSSSKLRQIPFSTEVKSLFRNNVCI